VNRGIPLASLAAAAILLAAGTPAAAQSSAPPPPKSPPAETGSILSSIPPPVAMKDRSATDLASTVNTASGLKFEGLVRATSSGSKELLEKGQKYFDAKGNLITAVDIGVSAAQGNYGDAARKGAAAVIDKCVDAAIAGACALTGPAAVGCNIAVQTIRFCGETYYNQSIGGWTVEKIEQGASYVSELAEDARREQAATAAAQEAQFNSVQSGNADYAYMAASQPAPYAPAYEADDGALFLDALMTGIVDATAPAPASAPLLAPSGACHPGHDEAAHPGGCHDGSRNNQ
jgi:hypothetical protein